MRKRLIQGKIASIFALAVGCDGQPGSAGVQGCTTTAVTSQPIRWRKHSVGAALFVLFQDERFHTVSFP